MLNKIRKSPITKVTTVTMIISLLTEIGFPGVAYALTTGPSQPEVQSFEPIATTDMVDLFSGDFNYNIPVMQVGHYPVNLFYHAGSGMDEEATWTGLGWNINPGVINRNMRGIPDDFNGDMITKEMSLRPDFTVGLRVGFKLETFGFDATAGGVNFRLSYNNYKGVGYGIGIGTGNKNEGALNLNLDLDSREGVSVDLSYTAQMETNDDGSKKKTSLGIGFNSRSGLKALTLNTSGKTAIKNNKQKKYSNSLPIITFTSPTFTPVSTPGMASFLGSLRFNFGASGYGLMSGGSIGADVHVHGVVDKNKDYPTAGYLYAGSNRGEKILQDINRDKEVNINKYTKHLHTTNHAYDTYSVTGQGIGGTYRPFHGNVGMVYDPKTDSRSADALTDANLSVGIELGPGAIGEIGADINVGVSTSFMGPWENDFLPYDNLQFTKSGDDVDDIFYEHAYFKTVGEKTTVDQDFYDKILDTKAVRFPLNQDFLDTKAENIFLANDGSTTPIGSPISRTQRDRRNQNISYLTADEATIVGLDKTLVFYSANNSGVIERTEWPRESHGRQGHHISEITVTSPDGTRYVYGLPAYNHLQEEYSFSTDFDNPGSDGLVTYDPQDRSAANNQGRDHYFSKESTPPYAYAYLLTAILSPDYIDVNDNGITDDDWGTYTKIDYFQAHENYRWRTPYENANFNRGMKSDIKDNKASFVYGEKEIWYVHKIETKTHVAEFSTSNRTDGKGVADRDGGTGSQSLRQLDEITLYSKPDRETNENDAVPIKTAHLRYGNTLCNGIPNGSTGKLTLNELYFTYGNNTSGQLSPYEFTYDANPGYNMKASDRWGNYKIQPGDAGYVDNPAYDIDPPSAEFPYTTQDKAEADEQAASWNLSDIDLPSGGHIEINYESDDYGYVQDKRAAVMTKVTGISKSSGVTTGNDLYDHLTPDHATHDYIHFSKPAGVDVSDLIATGDVLYFNFTVELSPNLITGDHTKQEPISGYTEVIDFGGDPAGTAGWLKVKTVDIETGFITTHKVHPVSKAAWQFTRLYRPGLAYDGSDWTESNPSFSDIMAGTLGMVSNICQMIAGFNQDMELKGKGRQVNLDRSWIRLNAPKTGKIGGGHRVKQISFFDNWEIMTSNDEPEMQYGQLFDYTNTDGNTSGVAAYEPLIGADENPFRVPVADYSTNQILAPDDHHYVEGPFGEQFFPGASVGYERVTVKNYTPPDISSHSIHRHATGKTVHEFYTAKEFPVITSSTYFDPVVVPVNPILSCLNVYTREYATASQGYAIEINDMHGKQKAVTVYPEPDDPADTPDPISHIQYYYKVDNENVPVKHLNNEVLAMDNKGLVTEVQVGKDIEMVVDSKQKNDYHMTAGIQINVDAFMLSILPIVIPVPWPEVSLSQRRLRYAVNTKVINRYAVLDRTEATQNGGATITTRNEIYDKETGEVLLTRTVNEHNDIDHNPDNDLIYNFSYPAHWAYDRMGPAYKNTGVNVTGRLSINDGIADLVYPADIDLYNAFVKGDEVLLYTGDDLNTSPIIQKAWVLDKHFDNGDIVFIDRDGNLIDIGSCNFKIIRSGRRNQQAISIGSVTSRKIPVTAGVIDIDSATQILNSSATMFSEEWQTPGDKGILEAIEYECNLGEEGEDFMDFLLSLKGVEFNGSGSLSPSPSYLNNPEDCDVTYTSTYYPITNMVAIEFVLDCDDETSSSCHVNIYFPRGIDPKEIISFDDNIVTEDLNYPTSNWTTFNMELTTAGGTYPFRIESKCINLTKDCDPSEMTLVACGSTDHDLVNPYLNGLRGIWRQQKGYAYNSTRKYVGSGNGLNTRIDGKYSDFTPFWTPNVIADIAFEWLPPVEIDNPDPTENKWVWTSEVTKYHPAGFEVENKDALGRYSSALYHYWYTQPSAVASNAQYREIAFDGFEDYRFQEGYGPNTCHYLDHWSFIDDVVPADDINIYAVHTGKKSLELDRVASGSHSIYSVTRNIIPDATGNHSAFMEDGYQLKDIDKLGIFSPHYEKKYVLGMWINKYKYDDAGQTFDNVKVRVYFLDDATPTPGIVSSIEFDANSDQPVIEGWKRFEQTFDVPDDDNIKSIKVEVENENTVSEVYIDDVRIHPFNSNMKTFVYDPVSLRLVAQLDENNYATFYEYDDQGNLIRTKKETERGIVTLQENRQNIKK